MFKRTLMYTTCYKSEDYVRDWDGELRNLS